MKFIEWSKAAVKDLRAIPTMHKARILIAIDGLAKWPNVNDVKSLQGPLKGSHRLRVGEYRVIFRVDDVILIRSVTARGSTYS